MIGVKALPEFIIQREKDFPGSTGAFSRILRDIGLSAKIVHRAVNKAGLINMLGSIGVKNVQGEEVQKLDKLANDSFIAAFRTGGECCGVASEENENFIEIEPIDSKTPRYIVAIDPLDGSSNIDVNVSVGTIFAIYSRKSPDNGPCSLEDFLRKGSEQIASGYIIYGSSTMLVYTTGHGVNGFTLDPAIGEFCLSHPNIKIPPSGSIYSVNHGNYNGFGEGIKRFMNYCGDTDKATLRPYASRYIGSMVADVHRNLIKGGIFMYPDTEEAPHGKLRLLYEANPMAFIVEQAGGRASDGRRRILDILPTELHERVPVLMGSSDMVKKAEEFIERYG